MFITATLKFQGGRIDFFMSLIANDHSLLHEEETQIRSIVHF